MAIVVATNHTDYPFKWATLGQDPYVRADQLAGLALAVDNQTHRSGSGPGVGRLGSTAVAAAGDVCVSGDVFTFYGSASRTLQTLETDQTVSGTKTHSGTITSSGGTFSGTWAGSPVFSDTVAATNARIGSAALLAYGGSYVALQVGGNASLQTFPGTSAVGTLDINQNTYFDGTNWKYVSTAAATNLESFAGEYYFRTAPSGTAGNTITWTTALKIDASGNLVHGSGTTKTPKAASANTVQGSGGSFVTVVALPANSHGTITVSSAESAAGSLSEVKYAFVTGASSGQISGFSTCSVGTTAVLSISLSSLNLQARGSTVTAPTGVKYWLEYAALSASAG